MSGTLFVVATPIGNLEDITARALRVLREVSVIAAEDTRRTHHLLSRYGIATPTTSLHQHNEARKLAVLVGRLTQGEDIALVSDAGTPTISDPGQRLVRAAIDAQIRVEPVPGPSAIVTALAASGLSGEMFTFLGFPPTRSKDRKLWFARLRTLSGLGIFFEAPHRIEATLAALLDAVGDREVVIGRELTKIHEEFLRGTISEVTPRLTEPRGEFTVIISLGHKTENTEFGATALAEEVADEFGRLIESGATSRREAVSELAARHGLGTNEVYRAIERRRKLVE